jgi:hypothetical protein
MPNISMCGSSTCPKRMSCYRNQASGTQPSQGRQSWMYFAKDGEPCDSYWPTELGRHLRNRLWQQASVVAGYYRPDRPDTEFVSVCNDDLRKLDEVAHGPLPNAPNEGAEVACDILTRDDGIRICPKCNGMWSPQYEVVCPRNHHSSADNKPADKPNVG